MKKINLDIKNNNGDTLAAHLVTPMNGQINNIAIFAHCFTCSSSLAVVRNISSELTNQGISVLNFDFTGLGNLTTAHGTPLGQRVGRGAIFGKPPESKMG